MSHRNHPLSNLLIHAKHNDFTMVAKLIKLSPLACKHCTNFQADKFCEELVKSPLWKVEAGPQTFLLI